MLNYWCNVVITFFYKAIRDAIEKRINLCRTCFNEECVQVRGIDSAIVNLNDHMRFVDDFLDISLHILQALSTIIFVASYIR
jgi:hypothetical protein